MSRFTDRAAKNAYLIFGVIVILRPFVEIVILKRQDLGAIVGVTLINAVTAAAAVYALERLVTKK
ncbi:MAG TPA: hypothetical protein VD907_05430 [Verrucomicrobiae bacterium]|nr:hypothetical protein [Verrucomicrobiae bacterium]